MRFYRYSYQPGESRQISAKGSFIRGIEGKDRYQIQLDDGPATDFETGLGFAPTETFSSVRVTNTASVAQIIEVSISEGEVKDSRFVGSGAISIVQTAAASVTYHPAQTIGAATEVLPLNDQRRSALVQCDGDVYVGNAADGVTAREFQWEAITALTLVPVSGSVEVRILEELNA